MILYVILYSILVVISSHYGRIFISYFDVIVTDPPATRLTAINSKPNLNVTPIDMDHGPVRKVPLPDLKAQNETVVRKTAETAGREVPAKNAPPDILRHLDCVIEDIPEKKIKAAVKRLQENEPMPPDDRH